jgi:hypothetical protein
LSDHSFEMHPNPEQLRLSRSTSQLRQCQEQSSGTIQHETIHHRRLQSIQILLQGHNWFLTFNGWHCLLFRCSNDETSSFVGPRQPRNLSQPNERNPGPNTDDDSSLIFWEKIFTNFN